MRYYNTVITGAAMLTAFSSIAKLPQSDSSYVRDFPGTITTRIYVGEKISNFSLVDQTRNENLQYRPNNTLSLGAGVTIIGIGINVSFRLPLHDDKEELYGKTKRLDIQVHRYRANLAVDAYLQRYRGYHFNDGSDVTQVIGPTLNPYFPELLSTTIGGSAMYVFNGRRYSLRSLVNQQDWQLRSAGSLMLGGSLLAHFLTNGDSSILPYNLKQSDFLDNNHFKEIDAYGLTINGGYGYNYVLKRHWIVSLSGDLGLGIAYSQARARAMTGEKQDKLGLLINTNVRFGAGYNSDKWLAGFYAIYRTDNYSLPFDDSQLRISEGLFRIVVARRLLINKKRKLSFLAN